MRAILILILIAPACTDPGVYVPSPREACLEDGGAWVEVDQGDGGAWCGRSPVQK